jgi:putative ABC transport system permease protein
MGIPLTEGRFFSASDRPDDGPVIVIDEKMARHFWPNESVLGKRVEPGPPDSNSRWLRDE